MKSYIALLVVVVVGIGLAGLYRLRGAQKVPPIAVDLWPKMIFSEKKKDMYLRLAEAFPGRVILFHVSYAMMLKTGSRHARAMVEGMIADFVILSENFTPMVIVDLDETAGPPKHLGREEMLLRAGYPHLRYSRVPGVDELRNDVLARDVS